MHAERSISVCAKCLAHENQGDDVARRTLI